MRSFPSILPLHPSIQVAATFLLAIAVSVCGPSASTAASKTETEARFKGLRALSAVNTKENIAEHKKKALRELKHKSAGNSGEGSH